MRLYGCRHNTFTPVLQVCSPRPVRLCTCRCALSLGSARCMAHSSGLGSRDSDFVGAVRSCGVGVCGCQLPSGSFLFGGQTDNRRHSHHSTHTGSSWLTNGGGRQSS
eukprot:1141394-Pelagomonas_calceolata.AAC.2